MVQSQQTDQVNFNIWVLFALTLNTESVPNIIDTWIL